MMRHASYLATPMLAIIIGCGQDATGPNPDATPASESSSPTTSPRLPSQSSPPDAARAIPDDIGYAIITEEIVPGVKRSLDIRLNRRVSRDVLEAVAMKLKDSDPQSYERTFIGYYLPTMKVDSGYWATTHFNPHLEVRILGSTVEQEQALISHQPAAPSREIIGSWIDERPYGGGRITIFRKDGRLFKENKYKDGSVGTDELSETRSPDGRRFDYEPDRGHGDYYLINSKGELQALDQDGLIMTAKKIN